MNAILSKGLFFPESWGEKKQSQFPQRLCSTTISNINNKKKYLLSSKSAY